MMNTLDFLDFPMQVKSLDDVGTFEGYASVYGNLDLGGDIVEKGAFKEFERTSDGQIRILSQHKTHDPVGKAQLIDSDQGLIVKGRLLLSIAKAREVYELMKAGIVEGLSVGYDVIQPGGSEMKKGVRHLKSLKLFEVSLVTFGMNPLARLTGVKAAEITTIREFEEFLRDVGGYSQAEAKRIASGGFTALVRERDVPPAAEVKRLTDFVKSLEIPKSLSGA